MTFVVDASVAVGWCLKDEENEFAAEILRRLADGDDAVVPSIWPLELANGLLVAQRRRRIDVADLPDVSNMLLALPVRVDESSVSAALGPILSLARQHSLTADDASYLELAMREGLPLATMDGALRTAAARVGVALVE
jgi:predicted nucleic acid-binding protein